MGNIKTLTKEYTEAVEVLRTLKVNSPEFIEQMKKAEEAHKNLRLYFDKFKNL